MMLNKTRDSYSKFDFQNTTGYIFRHPQGLIAMGHTASVSPWSDPNIHQHRLSEEYYVLLKGYLEFVIRDFQLTLYPNEILMVRPDVPHAVIGGTDRIEHFGVRTPAPDDKQIVGEIKKGLPHLYENERLISEEWGHRIPLELPVHKNCWLIGAGSALYESQHFILAYMDLPTVEAANASIGTRDRLHLHQKSWEYYIVLEGQEVQLVEEAIIPIGSGEMVEVPPNVKHTLRAREAPYRGFTLRVPVELNDKVLFET